MDTRDEENQKAREKSVAYKTMMGIWAFQDYLDFIKSVKSDAIKDLHQMEDKDATEARFGQIRGILKAVDRIERELEYILSWKE